MAAATNIPTLNTVLIVEDSNLPDTIFVLKSDNSKPVISQYVRLDSLPREIKESIRIWRDSDTALV
jgi:hypothetical protein